MKADARHARARLALEAERCRRDAHYFIFESQAVRTKDEHDLEQPVKPVPDVPYLRVYLDCLLVGGRMKKPEGATWAIEAGVDPIWLEMLSQQGQLFVEKSRDVYVTNLTCCYLAWRARAKDHQVILVQSKKDEDAARLVYTKDPQFARMSFIEETMPEHLKMMTWPACGAHGNLYYPNGTHVRAIPQGADIIRSEHPSVLFSDESAFQPEFGAAYTAALPAVEGGGQLIAVSSAEPGEFETIAEPEVQRMPTSIPGLMTAMVSGSIPLLRIHYSADPTKRPGLPAGDRWLARASGRYPGGVSSPRWKKEMEIEYRALGGTRLFPLWEVWTQREATPFLLPFFDPQGYALYGSYDHGWNNPSAYHVHGVNAEGQIITFWEFYDDHVPLSFIAKIIRGEPVRLPDGRTFAGNPFAGREVWKIADPSIWDEDQPMKDGVNKSTAFLFSREGVHFMKGERGGDVTVAEWLHGYFWIDPERPKYRICTSCPKLIWEIGQQRHRELSPTMALTANVKEELVDKDNHAWDGLKMFLKKFPPAAARQKAVHRGGSFEWWRNQAKRLAAGDEPRTYRREMVT